MGDETLNQSFPRSMRQKRILDAAAENPEASIDELVSVVPGASPELIESILEEFGDPATDTYQDIETPREGDQTDVSASNQDQSSEPAEAQRGNEPSPAANGSLGDSHHASPNELSSASDLTDRQREVLREIATDPEATQAEIGERLGITGSTVSQRLASIEGFDWRDRESFIDALDITFETSAVVSDGGVAQDDTSSDSEATHSHADSASYDELQSMIEQINTRLDSLEAAISTDGSVSDTNTIFKDPELVHRVVHACMESDAISESEELDIIKSLLT